MFCIDVGSVCSGIEAASVALEKHGFNFKWFSEIETFPSEVLAEKFPNTSNLGDICEIPKKLKHKEIDSPQMICGGTPCQAFSLAGWKKGLQDDRGNLTLKFVEIIESNDFIRKKKDLPQTIVLWENVEGVLRDKTNAFGVFLASLAGYDETTPTKKWPQSGFVHGPKRNVAWRVLDAKYFGLPQQRRRLYVLAGGPDFFPEDILFEETKPGSKLYNNDNLVFEKQGHRIEIFRGYTDCLYSAYGTKWNGNAAAYNGSLYVAQNDKLRRLTPLECERLMGFPDNYTKSPKNSHTNRYKAVGNSWSVPVIEWLGKRIKKNQSNQASSSESTLSLLPRQMILDVGNLLNDMTANSELLTNSTSINATEIPSNIQIGNMYDIIDVHAADNFYISPVGCKGILRRKQERKLTINSRLEEILHSISSEWSDEKIEKISRKQKRGKFSEGLN
jgi:DNA (cytosine-5)-methyltransferase 1